MGKLIPNAFNLLVVIYVALGSTSCSYGMAIVSTDSLLVLLSHTSARPVPSLTVSQIGSTIGQPSFYDSLKLAPQGEPGYSRTAQWIGAFNGTLFARDVCSCAHGILQE
jgi:hypothetical protein